MTEAHTPTPKLELIENGGFPRGGHAIIEYDEGRHRIYVDTRRDFTDPAPMARLIVLAVNSHARLVRLAEMVLAARDTGDETALVEEASALIALVTKEPT